jgi:hypothetical protein
MQNIRFIIKGAKAGETANALQAYLQTEWNGMLIPIFK